MSFPINTTIPAAGNDPGDDQQPMQNNFANINSYLSVDHVPPGATNNGYHKQVHLINESAPGLAGANGVLFSNTALGQSWPFWQNSAVGSPFQLAGLATNFTSSNGSVTLPGGLIIKFGFVQNPNTTSSSVTFTTPFPTQILGVFMTLARNASSNDGIWIDTSHTTNANKFSWKSSTSLSSASDFFYWLAIGN